MTKNILEEESTESLNNALFKGECSTSEGRVEVCYFSSLREAHSWLDAHREGVLKERRVVEWAYPICQKVPIPTWVTLK